MDAKIIGNKIGELRKQCGLTQQQLADKLAVTDKAVSKWETGGGLPDITILPSLSEVLGVSIDEILVGKKTKVEIEQAPDKTNKYRLLFAVNLIIMIISFCCVYTPPQLLTVWDQTSFILVAAFTIAITVLVRAITKNPNYFDLLITWGLPLACAATIIINAAACLIQHSWDEVYFLIVFIPFLYASFLGILALVSHYFIIKRKAKEEHSV